MRYYLRFLSYILTFCCLISVFLVHAQNRIDRIVIDPGHGGKDGGCVAASCEEKQLTLNIAIAIGRQIQSSYENIEIHYTRITDTFVPLHERIGMANELQADLFISIHVNAFTSGKANGAESYVLGLDAKDEQLDIVIRENASILLEKDSSEVYTKFDLHSPEALIIMSAYQQHYLDKSIRFANELQRAIGSKTQIQNRGVRQAPFVVLKMATMPAILFEAGFITDEQDRNYISSISGVEHIALSFVQAIKNYILQYDQAYLKEPNIFVPTSSLPIDVEGDETDSINLEIGAYTLKIQILTSLNKPISKADPIWVSFKDLEEIRDMQVYNYLTGNFATLIEAKKALKQIRESGYPGAYLVAINGHERINIK